MNEILSTTFLSNVDINFSLPNCAKELMRLLYLQNPLTISNNLILVNRLSVIHSNLMHERFLYTLY